ncbi:MAG TPA: carboxypeptidase-like regulatory domain-containing protein [Candidatus Thermoplasmatota archaeon]|nr:carboxypeptidase-like regulatory domain-containing protein [Candidatus Thermoplasmatota archaeon]
MRAAVLVLLVTLPALAGCLAGTEGLTETPTPEGSGEPLDKSAAPEAQAPAPVGSLVLTARFEDLTALAGVNITVANRSAVTGPDGIVRFDGLAPGSYVATARKLSHRTAQLGVTVLAGKTTEAEIILAAEGEGQHAHENGVKAHRDLYVFHGRFDCTATYLIITGDCLTIVDAAANATGAPVDGAATKERYLIDFPLDYSWTTLIVEMTWNDTTGSLDEGMTLALEPSEAPADGHAAKYARAAGGSPLALRLEAGEKHETATAEDMPNPAGGEVLRARAFLKGLAHRPGGSDFLGVGVAANHEFTLYVSIFYGEKPEPAYTATGGE